MAEWKKSKPKRQSTRTASQPRPTWASVIVNLSGRTGEGIAHAEFCHQFEAKLLSIARENELDDNQASLLLGAFNVSISHYNYLRNGDTVTITLYINEETMNEFSIRPSRTQKQITIGGLRTIFTNQYPICESSFEELKIIMKDVLLDSGNRKMSNIFHYYNIIYNTETNAFNSRYYEIEPFVFEIVGATPYFLQHALGGGGCYFGFFPTLALVFDITASRKAMEIGESNENNTVHSSSGSSRIVVVGIRTQIEGSHIVIDALESIGVLPEHHRPLWHRTSTCVLEHLRNTYTIERVEIKRQ